MIEGVKIRREASFQKTYSKQNLEPIQEKKLHRHYH